MNLALSVLVFARDFLLIACAIALTAFLILLPFIVVVLTLSPGPLGGAIMFGWLICLILAFGYYLCD